MIVIYTFILILILCILFFVFGMGEWFQMNRERFTQVLRNVADTFADTPASFFSHDKLGRREKLDSLYSPFVIRPRETVSLKYGGECTNPLYPRQTSPAGKGEMGSPNAYVEARFYGQRPILNPDMYMKMIDILFDTITKDSKLPGSIDTTLFVYQDQFSQGENYSDVMKYIMTLINQAKTKIPVFKEYAKVDTWGGEHFAFVDQKVYSFSKFDTSELSEQDRARLANDTREPKKLMVNFDLHNTLRSTTTNVTATVYFLDGKYYMERIHVTTKKPTREFAAYPVSTSGKSGITLNPNDLPGSRQPVPQWIYGNTIENQTFNSKGFHDPEGENIYIEGGIPEEYETFIDRDPQAYLLEFKSGQRLGNGGGRFKSRGTATNVLVTPNFPTSSQPRWTVNV